MKLRLFTKDFSLVVIGQIISILGSAILRFALDLYVLDITGRADIFAVILALSAIPGIVFTPVGGAIADRFSRRNLMVIFDFCSSAVVLTLFLLLSTGNASIVVIGIVLALLSLISSMYQPAVQASVPVLVHEKKLSSANGIVSGVGALSGLIGPVLGGVLYGVVGLNTLLIFSCAAFFLSAVMEIFIHIPFTKQQLSKNIVSTIVSDMKVGMHYVVKEKPQILRIILLGAALNLFLSPFMIIGVPYILRITMASTDTMYGIGMGIGQFSIILGALFIGYFSKKMSVQTLYKPLILSAVLLLPMAIAVTPIMLGLGYWPTFVMFFAFGALIMLLVTVISIFVVTTIQKETPNEMLGKVMAIILAISQCAAPLGQAMYGFIFEQFSAQVYIPILIVFIFTIAISIAAKFILKKRFIKEQASS